MNNTLDSLIKTTISSIPDSQNLDPSNVVIHDVELRHVGDRVQRFIRLTAKNDKAYYVMTDYLNPRSSVRFALTKKDPDTGLNTKNSCYLRSDSGNPENIVDKMNNFVRGILERIRYIMKIPEFVDKHSYTLILPSIKINNSVKYRNIIEFQDKKNNFSPLYVARVINSCRCKFLFKIEGLIFVDDKVMLDIKLIRIFPLSLDPLNTDHRLNVIRELNRSTSQTIESFNNLMYSTDVTGISKKQAKDEIKNILNKKMSR